MMSRSAYRSALEAASSQLCAVPKGHKSALGVKGLIRDSVRLLDGGGGPIAGLR